jgi:hypothetical protein
MPPQQSRSPKPVCNPRLSKPVAAEPRSEALATIGAPRPKWTLALCPVNALFVLVTTSRAGCRKDESFEIQSIIGGRTRTRTLDPLIKSQALAPRHINRDKNPSHVPAATIVEPLRVCRRRVRLSHAAKAISCNWAQYRCSAAYCRLAREGGDS